MDAIVQKLNQEKNLDEKVKTDLYKHIYNVVQRIIQYHANDGMDKFEQVSNTVKQTYLRIADPKMDYEINGSSGIDKSSMTNKEAIQLVTDAKILIKEKYDVGVSLDDKQLIEKNIKYNMPNIMEEMKMCEWAGINFG